jgi:hypothetical protein
MELGSPSNTKRARSEVGIIFKKKKINAIYLLNYQAYRVIWWSFISFQGCSLFVLAIFIYKLLAAYLSNFFEIKFDSDHHTTSTLNYDDGIGEMMCLTNAEDHKFTTYLQSLVLYMKLLMVLIVSLTKRCLSHFIIQIHCVCFFRSWSLLKWGK